MHTQERVYISRGKKQFSADLVTFTVEILNEKLHFFVQWGVSFSENFVHVLIIWIIPSFKFQKNETFLGLDILFIGAILASKTCENFSIIYLSMISSDGSFKWFFVLLEYLN